MGVYINMEMPKDCTECWFRKTARHEYLSDCQICPFSGETTPYTKRKDDCPLVPVPPHGDLIERDKLREKEFIYDGDAYAVVMSRDIRNAPTIIPASEEE